MNLNTVHMIKFCLLLLQSCSFISYLMSVVKLNLPKIVPGIINTIYSLLYVFYFRRKYTFLDMIYMFENNINLVNFCLMPNFGLLVTSTVFSLAI